MRKRRIMLVDDEASITRTLALYLSENGDCEVCVENEAITAVKTARAFRPDLMFIDIMMPDIDGGTLAAQIQADPVLRGTPIVFLTALVSRRETKGAASEIGGYPFLAKPVHPEAVLASIAEHARPRD